MDELNSGFEQLSLSNLKEKMQKILSDQSKLKEEMQKNLSDQSKINERIQKKFERIQTLPNYFPLDNDEDLKYAEYKVSEENATDPQFRSHLVDDLVFIGGKDVKDMVIRLMTKLFTKKLLSGYCWFGGSKSLAFSKLNILSVISEAIQERFPNNPKTEDEIKNEIVIYLR